MKSEETLRLCRDEMIRLDGDVAGRVISCRKGILWLTQTGTPGDHLIRAGEAFSIGRGGVVLISALEDSVYAVSGGKSNLPGFEWALFGFPANGAPVRGGEKKPFGLTIDTLPLILSLCFLFQIAQGKRKWIYHQRS